MDKPSPPPAPDYIGAAQQQGQNNIDMAKMQSPNVVSPYGTQTVTYGGTPDKTLANFDAAAYLKANPDVAAGFMPGEGNTQKMDPWFHYQNYGQTEGRAFTPLQGATGNIPTITQTLSPEQQKLLDQQNTMKGLLGNLGIQGADSLRGVVGTPYDYSGAPQINGTPGLRQQVIDAMMSRVNEDLGIKRDETNSNLVAAGHRLGSKAYDNQMNLINRQENDARNQAFLASGQEMSREQQLAMQARNQWLNEYQSKRNAPINEISSLMSGSQVTNPFAMASAGGINAQPAPLMGAVGAAGDYNTDLYNASAAQAGGVNQGLFGLGSAGLMAGGTIAAIMM
jgi:hypothetical protein